MSESTMTSPPRVVAKAATADRSAAAEARAGVEPAAAATPVEAAEPATVGHPIRTFVVVGVAMFMAQLDNLVVSTALPQIQKSLHAGLSGLQWTVSAYTLTFAVLLMTGATLGDRYGRKKMFVIGLTVFTLGSIGSALAPNIATLITSRAVQGVGGAIVVPLTLTLLSAAVPPAKRGMAIGGWGAIGGVAVAFGPVIGGAITQNFSWQWIFWINVPVGLIVIPLALRWLSESHGPARKLDVRGNALVSLGLFGVVYALIRGGQIGWTRPEVLAGFGIGALLLAGFLAVEARSEEPMLPLQLFRNRAFSLLNLASMLMFFGMFGSIFFLVQLFQDVNGESPLSAGLHMLPWTAVPMVAAPIAGAVSDRIGGRGIVATGLLFQAAALAWLARVIDTNASYLHEVPGLVLGGIGMGLFFAPIASMVLGSVRREMEGVASGANNAIREFGGVLGIAVMGAIFSARGGYGPTRTLSPARHFIDGAAPAVYTGAGVLLVASLAVWMVPRVRKSLGNAVSAAAETAATPVNETAATPVNETAATPVNTPENAAV